MNNQLKLTLASGVVHGLKCRIDLVKNTVFEIVYVDIKNDLVRVVGDGWDFTVRPEKVKPMMHPISKLTATILPDGKIPIVELAKMAFPERSIQLINKKVLLDSLDGFLEFNYNQERKSFTISEISKDFYFLRYYNCPNQLALFDQLDAWHINYRGVEAVGIETEKNDLETNGYSFEAGV